MSHRGWALVAVLGALISLMSPARAVAQDATGDWSRIIHPYGSLQCRRAELCSPRSGFVWDSANAFPRYPEVLAAVGVAGEAVVSFGVREDGTVDPASVALVRSSNRAFEASGMAPVRDWRFRVEATDRPPGMLLLEVHIIYAHFGACAEGQPKSLNGWAGWNRLVVTGCSGRVQRLEQRP